jgi:hypothetical protein
MIVLRPFVHVGLQRPPSSSLRNKEKKRKTQRLRAGHAIAYPALFLPSYAESHGH